MTKVKAVLIAENDPFISDWNVITTPGHTVGVAATVCSDDFLLEFYKTVRNTVLKAALKAGRGAAVPVRFGRLLKCAAHFHSHGFGVMVMKSNASA